MRKALLGLVPLLLGLLVTGCGGTLQVKVEGSVPPSAGPTVAVQVPAASPSATPAIAVTPGPVAMALGDLTVEEYPVVSKDLDTPDQFEFKQRILPAVLETRQLWRTDIFARQIAATQEALGRFGYRLVDRSSQYTRLFDLYRGEALVQANVETLWPIAVAASGSDFALVVETSSAKYLLIRRSGAEPWDPMKHGYIAPIMVGDDLVTVEVTIGRGPGVPQDWSVCRGGQTLYTVHDWPIQPADPIKGLQSWDGHWVLELDGRVIIDGEDLNKELGYDEIFAWQFVAGQPFYFFKKDGRIGVSYAGQTLAPRYDDVIHYKCCSPAMFNVTGNGTMVWGYALRGNVWVYIEMGVYR